MPSRRRRDPLPAFFSPQGSELELAWAAGLWDGEGSIGCYVRHPQNVKGGIKASMGQKTREVLERFCAVVGCGAIYRKGPMWQWGTSRQLNIVRMVGLLWPYLSSVKQEQMSKALALYTEARFDA